MGGAAGGQEKGRQLGRGAASEPSAPGGFFPPCAGRRAKGREPGTPALGCGGASQALVASMEAILGAFLQLLSLWFALAFLLIVLPSVFGLSLGVSELYLRALVKILEVSRRGFPEGCARRSAQRRSLFFFPCSPPRFHDKPGDDAAQLAGDDGECRPEHLKEKVAKGNALPALAKLTESGPFPHDSAIS